MPMADEAAETLLTKVHWIRLQKILKREIICLFSLDIMTVQTSPVI